MKLKHDQIVAEFESAWAAGKRPDIREFLKGVDTSSRAALLQRLIPIDLKHRLATNESIFAADYSDLGSDAIELAKRNLRRLDSPSGSGEAMTTPPRGTSPGSGSPADVDTLPNTDTHGNSNTAARAGRLTGSFGRYQIVRQLGMGGMGAVYLAEDPSLKRKVAIKVPFLDESESSNVLGRFRREARAIAKLQHPCICPVHEVSAVDGIQFMAMAYIDGKSMTEFASPETLLPVNTVVRLVGKLAMALHEAHSAGVIHRDLKPANLMLNHRKEPVILDFGLARSGATDETRFTEAGTLMGTPAYMPPEQVAGDPNSMGSACDIYSLGMVLYQLLCGQLPFTGKTIEILAAIPTDIPPPIMHYRKQVDPALDAICQKALRKNPTDRYASMREFAGALAKYLRDQAADKSTVAKTVVPTERQSPNANVSRTSSAQSVPADRYLPKNSVRLKSQFKQNKNVTKNSKVLLAAGIGSIVGAALIGGAIWLASILLRVETPIGTIVLQIDEPEAIGAQVTVDGTPKLTITTTGEKPLEIAADEERHTLRITKGGFETFAKDFSFVDGQKTPIRVRLEPLKVAKSVPDDGTDFAMEKDQKKEDSAAGVERVARSLLDRNLLAAETVEQDRGRRDFIYGTRIIQSVYYTPDAKLHANSISRLSDVPTLSELLLYGQSLESDQWREIGQLEQLSSLDLDCSECTEIDVQALASLRSLRSLKLHHNHDVTDRLAEMVAGWERLERLDVSSTSISDLGVSKLASAPALQHLDLNSCPINGGSSLADLAGVSTLQTLSLRYCKLDESAIDAMSQLSQLVLLDLHYTTLSKKGLQRLQTSLPNCVILNESLPTSERVIDATRQLLKNDMFVAAHRHGQVKTPEQLLERPDAIRHVRASAEVPVEVWQAIAKCPSIYSVKVTDEPDLDTILFHLSSMRGLRQIRLHGEGLTQSGLQTLSEMSNLSHLMIFDLRFHLDAMRQTLFRLPHLTLLQVQRTNLDDQSFAQLTAGTMNLEQLWMDDCKSITSDGMSHLASLTRLRELHARKLNLGDAAVPHLSKIKSLRFLDLARNPFSANGIAELRNALPECIVIWDDNYEATRAPKTD